MNRKKEIRIELKDCGVKKQKNKTETEKNKIKKF